MKIKKVYLGRKQIYPDGWSPGENTIAYYKLESDLKDYSGNGNDGTIIGNNGSFETIGGKESYKFYYNGSTGLNTRIDTGVQISTLPITISARAYHISNNDRQTIISNSSTNNVNCYGIRLSAANLVVVNGTGTDLSTGQTRPLNTWTHVLITIQSGVTKVYVNGVEKYSNNSGTNISTGATFKIGYLGIQDTSSGGYKYGFDGYMADVILEDKIRTAEEIENYYNQTKSLYGIN